MFHFRPSLAVCLAAFLMSAGTVLPCRAADRIALPDFLLRSWSRDDGLPAADVRAVARTRDGYLWVGTSRGLSRFDGVRFVTLNTNNAQHLEDNRITCLLVTRSGDLWVGTEGGFLARRRNGRFESVSLEGGRPGAPISTLAEDAEGALWIGTSGAGMWHRQGEGGQVVARNDGLPANEVSQLVADKQGGLWAISGGKLVTFNGERWELLPGFPEGLAHVQALAVARDGGIWAATASSVSESMGGMGGQIHKIRNRRAVTGLTPSPWRQDTYHTAIRALFEDDAGRLWAGMMGAGVYYLEPAGTWQALNPGEAFSQVLVNCIHADGEGSVWIGFQAAKLDQVRPRAVRTLHLPPGSRQNVVRMACARRDGSVWVGTDGAGVFRYENGQWTHYGREQGLANLYIGVLFEDRSTNLWVGTWNGLFRLEGDQFKSAIGGLVFRAMLQDTRGNFWIGTSAGVFQLAGDQIRRIGGTGGYDETGAMTVAEDASGGIWAGLSRRGLFRLVDDHFERCPADPWGGSAEIVSLAPDSDGGLWIGTLKSGLGYLKDGKSRLWTAQDGLPGEGIRAIIQDAAGNLWCGSDNGIFGCPMTRLLSYEPGLDQPLLFWHLTVADGLDTRRSSGIGQPVAARSADGRLWFPNWRALAVFDPEPLAFSEPVGQPLLEESLLDGAPIVPAEGSVIRASSSSRSYEFHYTAPNFRAPERVRFSYQLKGLDSDWVDAGPRRTAYYGRLTPGQYEFRVMASDPAGVWQEASQRWQVIVVPRFWERAWVQGFAVLALLLAVIAAVWNVSRMRLRRRMARIEAHEAMERERRRIARDLHDDLGAGLAEVVLLGELARQEQVPAGEMKSHVGDMTEKTRQLAAAMDEIVWTVNPRNDSLSSLASYVAEHARKFFQSTPIRCRLDIMPGLPARPLPAALRHNLFLAVKEALHNVVKHSQAREVWVRMHLEAEVFELAVQDDGRGFDLNSVGEEGDGLENMRERLEGVGGRLVVESEPGRGTRMRFTLPVPTNESAEVWK